MRLDLVADCDLQAVALGLQWLAANEGELAVRVALPSLRGQKFFRQLALLLTEKRPLAPRLFLEIDAHGLVECHEQIATLARVVSEFGAHIGVRRLAQQFGAVAQLHTLPLSYVKLGGGFVGGMSQSPQPAADGLGTADGARPEHRGVCGRRARRGNPAHPGRPGHQRDARSRRQAAGPAGLRSWPPDGGPRRAGPRSALVDATVTPALEPGLRKAMRSQEMKSRAAGVIRFSSG